MSGWGDADDGDMLEIEANRLERENERLRTALETALPTLKAAARNGDERESEVYDQAKAALGPEATARALGFGGKPCE